MLALILSLVAQEPDWSLPGVRDCTEPEIRALTASADAPFHLGCRARLDGRQVTRPVLFEGAESAGAGIDCGGGTIGRAGVERPPFRPVIAVWSRRIDGSMPRWSRPTDVTIQNCTVHGSVRIWGMGADGAQDDLRRSSRTAGHTRAVQMAAPSHVTLSNVRIVGTGTVPLYIGPGVTATEVVGVTFAGRSNSTAVYLDAESAGATIRGSTFDIVTGREQIAIDGSARNRIVGNRFALGGQGGVFLYRNCGEDGVIRHQTPSDNWITDNVFTGASLWRPRTVVVGSREGRRRYCGDDRGWPFGSSADDGDGAERNVVARNRTVR